MSPVSTGSPLLEATIDLVTERHRDLLKRGAILVDETDPGQDVRTLVYLEHAVQDARVDRAGQRRVVSKQMQFVEIDNAGNTSAAGYAPYLNYRPLLEDDLPPRRMDILVRQTNGDIPVPKPTTDKNVHPTGSSGTGGWLEALPHVSAPSCLRNELESRVLEYAAEHLVPSHLAEVRLRKESLIEKTRAAVYERLTKEINYWDHRAVQLKEQELAGRTLARLNSGLARQRADELTTRLQNRMAELDQEQKLSPLPPVVLGAALVVPAGLLAEFRGEPGVPPAFAAETRRSEQIAMRCVMEAERRLGYVPRDVSAAKLGYDVESSMPGTGRLWFIEVKGRAEGAQTVTVTKNEILTALNKPDDFILAIVEIDGDTTTLQYIRQPFGREPDFGVTSVNYDLRELLGRGEEPGR